MMLLGPIVFKLLPQLNVGSYVHVSQPVFLRFCLLFVVLNGYKYFV